MSAATKNLRLNQRQLDADGIEVGVSRQALEEALLERRWRPIDTAPKGVEVMLYNQGLVYVGRERGGLYRSEPQSEHIAWRAFCCGRFHDPTHWMPLPDGPEDAQ